MKKIDRLFALLEDSAEHPDKGEQDTAESEAIISEPNLRIRSSPEEEADAVSARAKKFAESKFTNMAKRNDWLKAHEDRQDNAPVIFPQSKLEPGSDLVDKK